MCLWKQPLSANAHLFQPCSEEEPCLNTVLTHGKQTRQNLCGRTCILVTGRLVDQSLAPAVYISSVTKQDTEPQISHYDDDFYDTLLFL